MCREQYGEYMHIDFRVYWITVQGWTGIKRNLMWLPAKMIACWGMKGRPGQLPDLQTTTCQLSKKKQLIYHSPDKGILWGSFLLSCLTSVAQEVKWWPKSFVFSISMITISIIICYNHYVDFCLILYGPNLIFL